MIRDRNRVSRGNPNAQPRAGGANNLLLRVVSAAVLAPLAIGAAAIGGWVFAIACALAAAIILCEWTLLVGGSADAKLLVPGFFALAAALVSSGLGQPGAAAGAIVIGAALAGLAVGGAGGLFTARLGAADSGRAASAGAWAAAGVLYAGIGLLAPVLLRRDGEWGFTAVLFLAATVWPTDIFAYFVGRAVGGPLLWPRLSPRKTWAGAIGGLAGGVAAGSLLAYASGVGSPAVGIIAALLSILAQLGDLFESAVKRRFGAKDTGALIPGHGGMMDRLDGFLFAALAAAVIGILRHGTDAPAQGLLLW